jgi:molybdenum cofactor cytidylyltransferase
MNTIGIILAAGSSSRMSASKQLLTYKGKSLIRHIADIATKLPLSEVYCVTGALKDGIIESLDGLSISYVHNPDYDQGMGLSLSVAMTHILKNHKPDAVLVMLTDQPLISINHYQQLLNISATVDNDIIITAYNDTYGAPSLFKKAIFSELLSLNATTGAKSIIARHITTTLSIDCPEAAFDVDTDEDYERLV